jgi:hypothetical protein
MVQTFSADRSDHTFDKRILPRRSRRDEDFANVHSCELFPEFFSVNPIAIAHQIFRGTVKREGLDDLLCGPCRNRMGCYVEMENALPVVSEHNEYIKEVERDRFVIWLESNEDALQNAASEFNL